MAKRKAKEDAGAPNEKAASKKSKAEAKQRKPIGSKITGATSIEDDDEFERGRTASPPKAKSKKASKDKAPPQRGPSTKKEQQASNRITDKKSTQSNGAQKKASAEPASDGRRYWLMKAEPESRLENSHDVKFSIDDLAAKTEPEPWDGIRAYPARNNLRSMKKGDLAFFYHSNCKTPAIVGIMEIVGEHSPDLSAHDPSASYYDATSKPDNPKWSVVHVTFRQKLKTPITLKELKAFQTEKGSPLENMQMLKQSRLSVSKVSGGEWEFLKGIMEKNGDELEV